MDIKSVGSLISTLRKQKGLTQNELGERLGISFQAVSKWERGETLPDTAILLDLADVLETTVDYILTGGCKALNYKGKITVAQMADGINSLKHMGELLGKDNILYRHAIDGINTKMNINVEDAFTDDRVFECFVAEAIIQNLITGQYIDLTDVKMALGTSIFEILYSATVKSSASNSRDSHILSCRKTSFTNNILSNLVLRIPGRQNTHHPNGWWVFW